MSDIHDSKTRSFNMSQIKGKNTKPELMVRKFLFSLGCRFRVHVNNLPGKPDIVLKKHNLIIQVHGCFWHGHIGCKDFKFPKTRSDFWIKKINDTKKRDKINKQNLLNMGWKVLDIWECEIKSNVYKKNIIEIINE